MNRAPIFIVGHSRSGTTLLRNLLRAHPHLTFPPESHFIPQFYRTYGDPCNDREACQLAQRILRLHWVSRWELAIDPQSLSGCRSFRELVAALYEAWALKENKRRWGDKTPQYVTEIPALREIFPAAKIIHIYRDGRDVALSWMQHEHGNGNLYAAVRSWKRAVEIGRQAGAELSPDDYLEVRFETLLSDPSDTLQRICGFLDEPFTNDMLTPRRIGTKAKPPLLGSFKSQAQSANYIVSSNSAKWKSNMSVADRVRFESVAGDLLEVLGYPVEGVRRRISPWERCLWITHDAVIRNLRKLKLGGKIQWVPTHLQMRWAGWRYRLQKAHRNLSSRRVR